MTSAITLAALLFHFVPSVAEQAVYLRPALLQGQFWRAWSGHLVHFGAGHLGWNLLLFVPAGFWLETLRPGPTPLFYLIAPAAISLLLLAGDAGLERYAGLSGLVAGQIALLTVIQLREGPAASRGWWLGALVLLAAKIGWEWHTGAPLLVHGPAELRSVPLAHLAGALTGAAFGGLTGKRKTR